VSSSITRHTRSSLPQVGQRIAGTQLHMRIVGGLAVQAEAALLHRLSAVRTRLGGA